MQDIIEPGRTEEGVEEMEISPPSNIGGKDATPFRLARIGPVRD